MKAYVVASGVVFGLIVAAHVWRVLEEGLAPARDPAFILFTLLAAVFGSWAWIALARSSRR